MPEINAIWLYHSPGNKYSVVTDAVILVSFINSKHNTNLLDILYSTPKVKNLKEVITFLKRGQAASINIEIIKVLYSYQKFQFKIAIVKAHKKISGQWHQEMFQTKSYVMCNPSGACLKANFRENWNRVQLLSQVAPKGSSTSSTVTSMLE